MKDSVPLSVLSASSYSMHDIQEKEGESTQNKKTCGPGSRHPSQEGGRGIPLGMLAGDFTMAATQQVLGVGAQASRHILRATHGKEIKITGRHQMVGRTADKTLKTNAWKSKIITTKTCRRGEAILVPTLLHSNKHFIVQISPQAEEMAQLVKRLPQKPDLTLPKAGCENMCL